MSSNITINGGTPAQQQAILAAHSNALTALTTAQTQAANGAGSFTDWFGPASATVQSAVSATYAAAVSALGSWQITYDLTNDVYPFMIAPSVVLIFEQLPVSAVSAGLWEGYWDYLALDSGMAAMVLSFSVAHQAISLSSANAVYDQLGVIDPDDALQLAVLNAAAAPSSLRNYLFYALPPPDSASE